MTNVIDFTATQKARRGEGARYVSGMNIVDIAKAIRAEIKELVKAGELPAGKYSVKTSRYSGGQSLSITVKAIALNVMNAERLLEIERVKAEGGHEGQVSYYDFPRHSATGKAILARLEALRSAYNYDRSDSQSDYFDVNFYGSASFDWQLEQAQAEALRSTIGAASHLYAV